MANYVTKAGYVERGYGQVEPNHLSAQRTGQIYAQLPAAADVKGLENGQFVKYDYANGVVNFAGAGEWMLVFNEVKLYYDYEPACNFVMVPDKYNARVYSPVKSAGVDHARNYEGMAQAGIALDGTDKPYTIETFEGPAMMEASTMVPRVFKTNVGDIFTTNTIADAEVAVNDVLSPNAEGILAKNQDGDMKWQVVKVYTMPDHQKGVKIMRIA
jgi:hypothetical protein